MSGDASAPKVVLPNALILSPPVRARVRELNELLALAFRQLARSGGRPLEAPREPVGPGLQQRLTGGAFRDYAMRIRRLATEIEGHRRALATVADSVGDVDQAIAAADRELREMVDTTNKHLAAARRTDNPHLSPAFNPPHPLPRPIADVERTALRLLERAIGRVEASMAALNTRLTTRAARIKTVQPVPAPAQAPGRQQPWTPGAAPPFAPPVGARQSPREGPGFDPTQLPAGGGSAPSPASGVPQISDAMIRALGPQQAAGAQAQPAFPLGTAAGGQAAQNPLQQMMPFLLMSMMDESRRRDEQRREEAQRRREDDRRRQAEEPGQPPNGTVPPSAPVPPALDGKEAVRTAGGGPDMQLADIPSHVEAAIQHVTRDPDPALDPYRDTDFRTELRSEHKVDPKSLETGVIAVFGDGGMNGAQQNYLVVMQDTGPFAISGGVAVPVATLLEQNHQGPGGRPSKFVGFYQPARREPEPASSALMV